jgi:hypothetical protein
MTSQREGAPVRRAGFGRFGGRGKKGGRLSALIGRLANVGMSLAGTVILNVVSRACELEI